MKNAIMIAAIAAVLPISAGMAQSNEPPPLQPNQQPFIPSSPVLSTDNFGLPGHVELSTNRVAHTTPHPDFAWQPTGNSGAANTFPPGGLPGSRVQSGLVSRSGPGGLPSSAGASSSPHVYQRQQSNLDFATERARRTVGANETISVGANQTENSAGQPFVVGRLHNSADNPPRRR